MEKFFPFHSGELLGPADFVGGARKEPRCLEGSSCLGAALELELCPRSCAFPGHCVNAKLCWNEFEGAAA